MTLRLAIATSEPAAMLLDDLVQVLHDERDAIVALDAEGVARATAAKGALMQELRALLPASGLGQSPSIESVRVRARRVYELAVANAALLDDAKGAMEVALGVPARSVTYDRRARPGVVRAARQLALVRSVG